MKKIIYGLLIFSIISCKKEVTKDYVLFSGTIKNNIEENFIIMSSNSSFRDTIKVSTNGTFKDTLRIDNGTHLVSYGKLFTRIYFEQGTSFEVYFDANNFRESLTFLGENPHENNYLLQKQEKQSELIDKRNDFYALNEDEFKTKSKIIKEALLRNINENTTVSEAFKELEKSNINYEYLNRLSSYQKSHAYTIKNPNFKVSSEFLKELKEINYFNGEDFLFSNNYKRLVENYVELKTKALIENNTEAEDIVKLKVIAEIPNEVIKNNLLYKEAKYGITYTNNLEAFYTIFNNASSNSKYKSEITENYKKLIKVAKGKPSPLFENYENYKGGTTSFNDLKGKYLYIDVWATWCGPCKFEIPYLKKIEKKYHDRNIEFVSISIDKHSDKLKWKAMVEKEQLGGVQLLADKDWDSQFVKDYLIKGVPRFILIDPQGNIVAANAPRPSEKLLVELFDKLSI